MVVLVASVPVSVPDELVPSPQSILVVKLERAAPGVGGADAGVAVAFGRVLGESLDQVGAQGVGEGRIGAVLEALPARSSLCWTETADVGPGHAGDRSSVPPATCSADPPA
jgi:hypothetical protein